MTHDPLCPMNLPIGDLPEGEPCPFCPTIIAARADEREQAARRVRSLLTNDPDWREFPPGWWDCGCMEYYCKCSHHGILEAIDAARGGEQA